MKKWKKIQRQVKNIIVCTVEYVKEYNLAQKNKVEKNNWILAETIEGYL